MKKIILLFHLLTCFVLLGSAQTENDLSPAALHFNVGPEVGFPVGNNSAEFSIVFGASAQLEYTLSERFALTGNVGYLNFGYKTVAGSGNTGYVPLLAGFKVYISNRAFFHMQAGAAFATSTIIDNANHVYLSKGSYFAYSPGIGHKFGKKMEGEFKFLGISNSKHEHVNSFGLRFAYNL